MLDDFVDAIFPLIRESLYVSTLRQKVIFEKLKFKCEPSLSLSHTNIDTSMYMHAKSTSCAFFQNVINW